MGPRLFQLFVRKYDPGGRVVLLLSSQDSEVGRLLDCIGASGACLLEEGGVIQIKIHDAGNATKATWLEELSHALQFLTHGHINFSRDDPERAERECEVADCLLERHREGRLELTQKEVAECQAQREYYRSHLND